MNGRFSNGVNRKRYGGQIWKHFLGGQKRYAGPLWFQLVAGSTDNQDYPRFQPLSHSFVDSIFSYSTQSFLGGITFLFAKIREVRISISD
jgi:hypothetical protein